MTNFPGHASSRDSAVGQARTRQEQWRDVLVLVCIVLGLTAAFRHRAFSIDDPLFLWAAKHIQAHPTDPYGFAVNWYGSPKPMSVVMQNPPLAAYYLAFASLVLGWSESALHLAFALPALALAIGMYLVARRLCARPLLATLVGVLSPVFAVSSLTVMCDVLMLAFWVFAVYFWIEGMESRSHARWAATGALITASALTKYFGVTLIPLLFVYSIARERRLGIWVAYFLIPSLVLAWYQWKTGQLYSRGLLFSSASYATGWQGTYDRLSIARVVVAFTFTGGCLASAAAFAAQLWSRAALVRGVVLATVITLAVAGAVKMGAFPLPTDRLAHWLLAAQVGLWTVVGMGVVSLAIADLKRCRDANSLLLSLWLLGTFFFAGFVNWSTNARSLLPMVAPLGILVARRLDVRGDAKRGLFTPGTVLSLVAAATLSFLVAWADTRFADTARIAAAHIYEIHRNPDSRIWFEGHWGFQYYMEKRGARVLDDRGTAMADGDLVALPDNNTNLTAFSREGTFDRDTFDLPACSWLATLNARIGAGFYWEGTGPLPFAVGSIRAERFVVLEVGSPPQGASESKIVGTVVNPQ